MTGLFDSVIGSVSSLFDSPIASAVGAAGKAYLGNSKDNSDSLYKQAREIQMLNEGVSAQSYNQSNKQPQVGDPLKSVDPDALNNIWRERLHKFSEYNTDTAVKPR